MKKFILVLLSAILLFSLGACKTVGDTTAPNEDTDVEDQLNAPAENQTPMDNDTADMEKQHQDGILFDPYNVQMGDRIGEMTIVDLSVDERDAPAFSATVKFEGKVTLHGTYYYETEHEFLQKEIRFHVANESLAQLPKLIQDERFVWFTLENREEAMSVLGISENEDSEGEATIVIDNYTIHYAPTDIWNTATLDQVQ